MKHEVKDVPGLAFNAKHFDRYFLNDLEWDEWRVVIEQMKENLTDEAIESSIADLPVEVRNHPDNLKIIAKLKSRRNDLVNIGKTLYDYLNQEVQITGTNHADKFKVKIKDDGSVNLKVFAHKKGKDIKRFDRTFYPEETKEIRLFGLEGKDEFIIEGDRRTSIRIRVIGGEDHDELNNRCLLYTSPSPRDS